MSINFAITAPADKIDQAIADLVKSQDDSDPRLTDDDKALRDSLLGLVDGVWDEIVPEDAAEVTIEVRGQTEGDDEADRQLPSATITIAVLSFDAAEPNGESSTAGA